MYTYTPADVTYPPFRFFEGLVPRLTGSMCAHIQTELFTETETATKAIVYMALEMFYKMPAHHGMFE